MKQALTMVHSDARRSARVPVPPKEAARLLDLARYQILDTSREEVFDRVTRTAARLFDVPVAAINFIDVDRHWTKSMVGLEGSEVPREHSLCAWTILQDTPFVVPDAHADDRFAHSPLVTRGPRIHMYAGVPLVTPSGQRIGSLCVADSKPHTLDESDLKALQDLAALVSRELEWRVLANSTQAELAMKVEYQADLQRSLHHAQTLEALHELIDSHTQPQDVAVEAASLIGAALALDWVGLVTFEQGVPHTQRVYARPDLSPALHPLDEQLNQAEKTVTQGLGDLTSAYYLTTYSDHPDALPAAVDAGVQSVAWIPLGGLDGTSFLLILVRSGEQHRQPWRCSDRVLLEAAARSVRAALNRRAALEAERSMARHDALTGLLNRRAFSEDLEQYQAEGMSYTLALMDLDGFKALNDTEGHTQGDQALRSFGEALAAEVGANGRAYRLGGDEFTLLFRSPWKEQVVYRVAGVAIVAAQQTIASALGISIGVAQSTEAESITSLIALADARMYESKRHHKGL